MTFSKIITAPHPQCFMRSVLIVARLTGLCGVQLEVTRGSRIMGLAAQQGAYEEQGGIRNQTEESC